MLFRRHVLDGIRAGRVDLAFRRWDRPRVQVGTRMRTAIGLVEVTAVDEVDSSTITENEARSAGAASRIEALEALAARGDRPIFRVGLRYAGPDPRVALREADDLGDEEAAEIARRLAQLDRASRRGPWTYGVLELVEAWPATRAAELAARLGRDTASFKRDVRKLKELGLTESLGTGYRLSPRGRTLIRRS